jgi:hypothetical protein
MVRAKHLSDLLLRQKALTEAFFTTTLEMVRRSKAGLEGKARLPPLRQDLRDKVDISELDIENKEKIIRMIYSRILGNKRTDRP